jgi:hypothetical protein
MAELAHEPELPRRTAFRSRLIVNKLRASCHAGYAK